MIGYNSDNENNDNNNYYNDKCDGVNSTFDRKEFVHQNDRQSSQLTLDQASGHMVHSFWHIAMHQLN